MRMRHVLAVAVVAVGAFVVACSGSPGSSCGSYYDSVLAHGDKCQSSTLGLDPAAKPAFEKYCGALATAPGANNFAGQVDQCNSAVQNADCNTTPSCRITGSLADGAACGVSTQCSGGRCDNANTVVPNSEITCGKCASYVPVGGACSTGAECDPDTSECRNGTCQAYAPQGASCQNAACAPGLQCDINTQTCLPYPTKGQACTGECQAPYRCISGTCADAVQQGGSCPTNTECASSLQCDPTSHTCVQPTLAAAGQPCGFVQTQIVECQSGLKCQPSSTGSSTCVVPKNAGDACTVGKSECGFFLLCVNGTCQVPDYSVCK